MKTIVCRKMTPKKKFSQTTIQKKHIVCLGKIFIPQLPKKIMVRPIDRQGGAVA